MPDDADDIDAEPEQRPRQYPVSLPAADWRDLVILHQSIPMLPIRWQRIVDSVQVQTSRLRE